MANSLNAESVLRALTNKPSQFNVTRLELLFRDFVANVFEGATYYEGRRQLLTDGMTERGAQLGLLSSAKDMDDVDWRFITHPGSIIWSVAVASGAPFEKVFESAAWGYRTGATVANLFGAKHRSKWHVTSTSGAFAATSTAAIALGLTKNEHLAALKLCAANIGASSQPGFERLGATQFNRSAAITLGITSAKAAAMGAVNTVDIWDGPRGLIEMFSVEAESQEIFDGISSASLRLFPTNGFAHSAVFAALDLLPEIAETVTSIHVSLPLAVKGLLDESRGGNWWNPRFAVAAVCKSKDPMRLTDASTYLNITHSDFREMPTGAGAVKIIMGNREISREIVLAPEKEEWINKKFADTNNLTTQELYLRCSSFPLASLR
jgi:hypothetical protein